MANPRGRTGSVRGLSAAKAQGYIVAAVRHIRDTQRGAFTRAGLREYLKEEHGLTQAKAEGVVFAFMRQGGIAYPVNGERGMYRLHVNAEEEALNRDWRFNVGRLGLAETRHLMEALAVFRERQINGGDAALLPRLEDTFQRGMKALNHVSKKKGGNRAR
jgi:hypothetical protein